MRHPSLLVLLPCLLFACGGKDDDTTPGTPTDGDDDTDLPPDDTALPDAEAYDEVRIYTDYNRVLQSRVERHVEADGSETLHGETVVDYTDTFPLVIRLIEDVELDADGRLLRADLQSWNTVGTMELEKRIEYDPGAGTITITRPAGTLVWEPGSSESPPIWGYASLVSDPWFNLPNTSPVSAWVIDKAFRTGGTVDLHWFDFMFTQSFQNNGLNFPLQGDFYTIDPDEFVVSIAVAGSGLIASEVDEDPGDLLDFTVTAGTEDISWPNCNLPADIEQFDVESADGTLIFGEIARPAGAPGNLPMVVFNASTGGSNRNNVVGGIARWDCLAKPLVDAGFGVIRYDDRGHGLTGGYGFLATFDNRAEDALVVAEFAAALPDIHPDGLFLLGHGEGVAHAAVAADQVIDVDGVLFVAGPGGNGADLWVEQAMHLLEAMGFDQLYIDEVEEARWDVVDGIQNGTLGGTYYGYGVYQGFSLEYWDQLFQMEGLDLAADVNCPAAIFQGDLDSNLDANNAIDIETEMLGAGNPDVTRYSYPDLGHFLQAAPTDTPAVGDELATPIDWDEDFVNDAITWMSTRLP